MKLFCVCGRDFWDIPNAIFTGDGSYDAIIGISHRVRVHSLNGVRMLYSSGWRGERRTLNNVHLVNFTFEDGTSSMHALEVLFFMHCTFVTLYGKELLLAYCKSRTISPMKLEFHRRSGWSSLNSIGMYKDFRWGVETGLIVPVDELGIKLGIIHENNDILYYEYDPHVHMH